MGIGEGTDSDDSTDLLENDNETVVRADNVDKTKPAGRFFYLPLAVAAS